MQNNKHRIVADLQCPIEKKILSFHDLCIHKIEKGFLTKPTFIGVGAGRCGTSALYQILRKHKSVYLSPLKEVNYFGIRDKETIPLGLTYSEYLNYFLGAKEGQLIGEFSPAYLTNERSLIHMHARLPQAKIIITLRNPYSRFISQFKHHLDKHKIYSLDSYVTAALRQYNDNFPNGTNWYLPVKNLYQSLYFSGIDLLINKYGKDDILIIKHNSLLKDYKKTMNEIYSFLSIDQILIPNERTNQSIDDGIDMFISEDNRNYLLEIFEKDLQSLYGKHGIEVE